MCSNCQYKGIHVSLPSKNSKQDALDMANASGMWFSGEQARNMTVDLMCQFAAAENEELKKQVSALTQALETQNRENQPHIKRLEDLLKQAKSIMERNIAPQPDQHALNDMFHFVYNDLESLFPSPSKPVEP